MIKITDDNIVDAKYDLTMLNQFVEKLEKYQNAIEGMDLGGRVEDMVGMDRLLVSSTERSVDTAAHSLGEAIEALYEHGAALEEAIEQYEADKWDADQQEIKDKFLSDD